MPAPLAVQWLTVIFMRGVRHCHLLHAGLDCKTDYGEQIEAKCAGLAAKSTADGTARRYNIIIITIIITIIIIIIIIIIIHFEVCFGA